MKTKLTLCLFFISIYCAAQNIDVSNGRVTVSSATNTSGSIYGDDADLLIKAKTSSTLSLNPLTPGNLLLQTDIYRSALDQVLSGKVGIGTLSPSSKLHVSGDLKVDKTATELNPNILVNGLSNYAYLNWTSSVTTKKWISKSYLTTTDASNYLSFDYNNGTTTNHLVRLSGSGNVGIGTTNPSSLLHVSGVDNNGTLAPLKITDETYAQNMLIDGNEIDTDFPMYLNYNSDKNVILVAKTGGTGNVGIGTNSPNNKLDVKGIARAYEVIVESGWADYVFDEKYELPSLHYVEKYIEQNKHLPEIPSAKEIQEKGAYLSELVTKMMAKIEELTLYTIQQQKEIEELRKMFSLKSDK